MAGGCAWAGFLRLSRKLPSVQQVPWGPQRDAFIKSVFVRLSPQAKTTLHRNYMRYLQRRGVVPSRTGSDLKPNRTKVPVSKLVRVKVPKSAPKKIRAVAKAVAKKAAKPIKKAPTAAATSATEKKIDISDPILSMALNIRRNLAVFKAERAKAAALAAKGKRGKK